MSEYNAEQFIEENLVEFPKTKKEMIWCLNEYLKDTLLNITDSSIRVPLQNERDRKGFRRYGRTALFYMMKGTEILRKKLL